MIKLSKLFQLPTLFFSVVLLSAIFPNLAFAEDGISLWTRRAGDHSEGASLKKMHEVKVRLETLKLSAIRVFDIQYNKKMVYKGVYFDSLLRDYPFQKKSDLALLHFENGMIIPMKLRTLREKEGSIFLALQVRYNKKKWTSVFPKVQKIDQETYYRDPNPIEFAGNKVVVFLGKKHLTFKQGGKTLRKFTPFAHIDSLVGIEMVNEKAYYRQFKVKGSDAVQKGFDVFKRRCQFCHGVKQVGASFGWDYVDPLKLSEKRNSKNLHLFVKYPRLDAMSLGTQMPNQVDMRAEESKALWKWIDAVSRSGVRNYKP